MYPIVKRLLDILLSLIALIVLSPLLIIVAVAIRLTSPGPIFFCQRRVGLHKEYFTIYKFRTMRMDAPKDIPTHLLGDPKNYTTPIGNFLRKTSIDELPQLINILKGDMSIVGPRPALWNEYDLVAARDKVGANNLVPGLTGWAQVNGRDNLLPEEKAHFDGEYVQNFSFRMDIKCIFKTVSYVIRGSDIIK